MTIVQILKLDNMPYASSDIRVLSIVVVVVAVDVVVVGAVVGW